MLGPVSWGGWGASVSCIWEMLGVGNGGLSKKGVQCSGVRSSLLCHWAASTCSGIVLKQCMERMNPKEAPVDL